jgi:signal transduction histidine kinase
MPSEVSRAGGVQELERTVEKLTRQLCEAHRREAATAVENVRLFEAEQSLRQELAEALARQTATSEVLGVIASSPTDVQPVFDTIARSAALLCEAFDVMVLRVDGDVLRLVAHHGPMPAGDIALHRGTVGGRTVLDRRVIHVGDVQSEVDEFPEGSEISGHRTTLSCPLLKANVAIGNIQARRNEVRPFSDHQISLLKTFADQAVIAIENTRLFEAEQASNRRLQESLHQQTATADVLKVISRSTFDLQTVLDALVESAARLCAADTAAIWRPNGENFQFLAHYAFDTEYRVFMESYAVPVPVGRGSVAGRTLIEGKPVQVADVLADPEYTVAAVARTGGFRTLLGVPLMREGIPIGVITLQRTTVQPFTDKQIELLMTFADQAVIAIENTRLFEAEQASKHELTEALEQQTATADVLKVISRSALDLQKVLDALVESAARLCDANDAAIFQVFGDNLRLVADYRQTFPMAGAVGQLTLSLVRGRIVGRAVIDRRTIQVADALAEADEYPESWKIAQQYGHRTMLAVPLVHAGEAIGVIYIRRAEVRPFTERQIELVNTFADQAVIAIENTRLFEVVQARTRELAKTVEDLEIASQHKNQFVANMSHELRTPLAAILGYAELIQEGFYEPQGPKSLDALTRICSNGKHLLGLINTVLDIAKIESGQFTLNMTEYAIESVVETVRAATESLAQNKKLTLTTTVDKPLPVGLGDEQRLTQVLLNLVGNAIKFTDAGEVRIAAGARNDHFTVSVTDTGPGIPLDQQGRIFDQFHQVDSSLTKAKGGTGLGLAIAKQIVEMHGGRIWVESAVGKGSTFQIEIPTRAEFRQRAV